ncbi:MULTISPECIES: ribosome silencing factor [Cryobacterium]|uniref:Ribosomal silencing factor RsfS n=1 Tax=Cryobacterium zongtaii TaxID=1259217 RepID=A0A2S3ZIV3_9MICO|nr:MULTISPECIES: ribosome silencing factor [Cryobacterium]POH65602.1 ribosome silencing factor [Cryobacterium zongtaii]POH67519.1 ribosome silencing factor [Cryobacterium zongtaii]TFC45304.1 ribosome silencing factor [Cryobacterium sp. TMN-39-2]
MTASAHALELLKVAAAAADSKAGEDLVAIDVSNPLPLADIFLIVTGRSERNVVAIAGEIEDKLIEAGYKPLRREGRAEGRWILVDFGDLVVHVFHEEERVYYSLERLWKDCPVIPIDQASARAIDEAASSDESVDTSADGAANTTVDAADVESTVEIDAAD